MTKILKYWPILAIILAFLSGYFSKSDNSKELEAKYKAERKLIIDAVVAKQIEVTNLTERAKKKDERIAALETEVANSDKTVKVIEARSREKVEIVAKYTPVQRDSFFYAKYPGQDTIRNVDSRKVAVDLVRLEGADALNIALTEQVDTLKAEVAEQKERIEIGDKKFAAQKEITSDFIRWGESWRDQSEYYRKREKKARVKSKFLAAGLVGVLVLSLLLN